ncbi:MAG: hypothetical protein D6729_02245 [Deltaproteobacteria bacterium]|nr:MAG: hypothetical protein D6729_02245 [Deltaproteobacteria bacterium]
MRTVHLLPLWLCLACAPALAQSPRPPRHDPQVLDRVLDRVREVVKAGGRPVVVFDLDSTLFDNRYRTWRLLLEWAERTGAQGAAARIRALPLEEVRYSLDENLKRIEVSGEEAESARRYWLDHFFTDRGATLDRPEAGAVAYVRAVRRAGAVVVYLTGRDAPRMAGGTVTSLRRWGFPVGIPGVVLLLKPEKSMEDLAFKTQAREAIDALGQVVATFDNQPENTLLFAKTWPKATNVWLDTNHSPGAPELPPAIPRVRNFRRP